MNKFLQSRKVKNFNRIVYFTGIITLCNYMKDWPRQIKSMYLKRRALKSLKEKYDDGWVVITGATSGSGLSFANEFSKLGFKTLLIAREEQKLNRVTNELERAYGTISKSVLFDFSTSLNDEECRKLEEEINRITAGQKISVLVNNVGIQSDQDKKFDDLNHKQLVNYLSVNCLSQMIMYKIFWTRMRNQNSKSLIIDVSSTTADIDVLGMNSVYQSTKIFNSKFSEVMKLQNKLNSESEKIDNNLNIMTFKPGMFVSNLSEKHHNKNFVSDYAETCVVNCLFDVVNEQYESHGSFKHKMIYLLLSLIPKYLRKEYVAPKLNESFSK
jgi:short-subunit dehydrogenase